ncbi:unnamed protein product [Rotaria socialis]|nr:unnamed protein product [Rotaria socialis]
MAINYHNIANILRLQENYTNCLDYYVRAHKIRECYLPPNDTDIADSLYNIGFTYDQLNQPTRALEHLKKAADIYKGLPTEISAFNKIQCHIQRLLPEKSST